MIIGSNEWLIWRKSKITASDCPVILNLSPYSNPLKLWGEKLDLIDPPSINSYMQRGLDLENEARICFEEENDLFVLPQIIQHPKYNWMAASLDGINLTGDIIVEIKCNGKKNHEMALVGIVPDHHYAQIQHQIECANVEFAYYFSYDGEEGITIKVKKDESFINKMIENEFDFWNCLNTFMPPNNSKQRKKNVQANIPD